MTDGVRNLLDALAQMHDHWSAHRVASVAN
jgi:hypothetical protein